MTTPFDGRPIRDVLREEAQSKLAALNKLGIDTPILTSAQVARTLCDHPSITSYQLVKGRVRFKCDVCNVSVVWRKT